MTDVHEPSDPDDTDGIRYADAIDELEAILAELEDDSLDVDLLSTRVARAATLIRLCRARITETRVDVERIVADLERPA
jgi:exodeoxyribonuclease VII small subunit